MTIDELQASFDKALDARFGSLRAALREIPGVTGATAGAADAGAAATLDLAALRAAAAAHPGNYAAQLEYGQALAAAGDRAAFEPLEKAAALVPGATGEDSPHALMARARRAARRHRARDRGIPGRCWRRITRPSSRRARLAALVEKPAPHAETLPLAYDRVVAIDPFDPAGAQRARPAGARRTTSPTPRCANSRRRWRSARPTSAAAHCDLGEAYLLANRPADAKAEALAALEIAPSFDRAQELLLRAIKGAGAAGGRQ